MHSATRAMGTLCVAPPRPSFNGSRTHSNYQHKGNGPSPGWGQDDPRRAAAERRARQGRGTTSLPAAACNSLGLQPAPDRATSED